MNNLSESMVMNIVDVYSKLSKSLITVYGTEKDAKKHAIDFICKTWFMRPDEVQSIIRGSCIDALLAIPIQKENIRN